MKKVFKLILIILLLSLFFLLDGKGKSKYNESKIKEMNIRVKDYKNFGGFKIERIINEPYFAHPVSGVNDENGNIYVLDVKMPKLYKFSEKGKLIKAIGRKGNGPGEFTFPVILKYYNGKLYVFDYKQPFLNIFDKELNFFKQRKFVDMRNPNYIEFVTNNRIIVSSATMEMFLNHRLFLFSVVDGNLIEKFEKEESSDIKNAFKGGKFNMKYPALLSFDKKTGDFLSAGTDSYIIEFFRKNFNKEKIIRGDITFKKEIQKTAQGKLKIEVPIDKGIFLKIKENKIFYGYLYNDEVILDIIENDRIKKRFKSKRIHKIFSMIDQNRFLVSFGDDEEPSIGIVSIEL